MRKKLIELIGEVQGCGTKVIYGESSQFITLTENEELADHLIANSVTFAEDIDVPIKWISVKDRLPTEKDANEKGVVLVRNIGCPIYDAMDWDQVEVFRRSISHWMPLPEPPEVSK